MRYLPGRVEILLFAILAVICGAIVSTMAAHDTGLSVLAFPVFLFAAIMGLWKSGRLRGVDE
jgi:hypothetical protein